MKVFIYLTIIFSLLGCSDESYKVILCKDKIFKKNIDVAGEKVERIDCINAKTETRCSVVITKKEVFIGCSGTKNDVAHMLCVSPNQENTDNEISYYSCTSNNGTHTTKCEYKNYENDIGEINCHKN